MRLIALFLLAFLPGFSDEGMWLFNQFPAARVQKAYGFQVTQEFLDHLRLASPRLNNGGSGSFVSPAGLLFTNHHVAADCIQKIGTAEHNYMRDGFYAPTRAAEVKCPDLEVNILLKIEPVTEKVKAGIRPNAPADEANRQRKAAMARIEKECNQNTGNRCDVVTLFSGQRFDLYQYKKYTDLRLVFAPEFLIAFFGGDPDNFTFPRYDLDVSFFRAYENGKPAHTPQYLRWSAQGAADGQLVFVAGNPGTTSRLDTVAQLDYLRDVGYPIYLERIGRRLHDLGAYSSRGPENARVAHDLIFSFQNSDKAIKGELAGLRDPALMNRKREEERKLRAAVEAKPAWRKQYGGVWDEVARAYKQWAPYEKPYTLFELGPMGSDLFRIARRALRLPEELKKPNETRLEEYRDSNLESLKLQLYSSAPITDSMEEVILAAWFDEMLSWLGPKDQTVNAVLGGRSVPDAAREYVRTSRLKNVAERKRLAGSLEAVESSSDGMIRLVRAIDARARELRRRHEDTIEAADLASAARIAAARLAVYGPGEYPDATFTPRVSYGKVAGYRDKAGNPVPWATDFAGLYRKATGRDPYELPPRWLKGQASLNPATPLNFVSTADITGGNSGSPTVNTSGEVVGIIFDGNLESLPNTFVYTETRARAVHVASQAIVEALRKLYHTDALLAELGAGR